MLKNFVFPILVLVVLAFIRGIVPTLLVTLALAVVIGVNGIGNSRRLGEQASREIITGKSGAANASMTAIIWTSIILAIVAVIYFVRAYDWVVAGAFILAWLGYAAAVGAPKTT